MFMGNLSHKIRFACFVTFLVKNEKTKEGRPKKVKLQL